MQLVVVFFDCVSVQKMSRMKRKAALKNALYDFLDWLEKEQPELIIKFWEAAFKDVTLEHYATLRRLRCSLMEGQFLHPAHDGTHVLRDSTQPGIMGPGLRVGPKPRPWSKQVFNENN